MKKLNNERGITLVALIVTIIVMLILVAVTINISLNGGIFEQAREASSKTQKEAEKETLISVAVGALDKDTLIIKGDELKTELENKDWTVEEIMDEEDENVLVEYKCESPNENIFTVKPNGKIENSE